MNRHTLFFRLNPVCSVLNLNVGSLPAGRCASDMVREARLAIENLSAEQAYDEISKGSVMLVDIREPEETVINGKIAGSVNVPRGMLEFCADAGLPSYKPGFVRDKRILLYCATGGRSALSTRTLKEMGFTNVAHIEGGIKAWKDAGFSTVQK